MNIAFYNGVSGMVAYQQDMDTLAHNMANVNNYGYKVSRTSFSDLLYTRMNVNANYGAAAGAQVSPQSQAPVAEDAAAQEGEAQAVQKTYLTGHGVKAANLDLIYGQGAVNQTGNALDFALVGDGFFAVERNERLEYTRNGAFNISVEGNKGFLVASDGGYVLDGRGKRIELTRKEGSNMFDTDPIAEKLGVYQFPNPYGLMTASGSSFVETDISGEPRVVKANNPKDLPYQLVQSSLEFSNVDISQEMVGVIITQKAFQFNAKMVQTADQLEEIVNNLR